MKSYTQKILMPQNSLINAILIMMCIFCVGCHQATKTSETSIVLSNYITTSKGIHSFTLSSQNYPTPIILSKDDFKGVQKIAHLFKNDIEKVTGSSPDLISDSIPEAKEIIIVGTIEKNPLIKELILSGKINTQDINGKWESSLIEVVNNPFPNVEKALVIIGSDKRGAIYGMFDVSRKIGVSPWYWWADVPVVSHDELYVNSGRYVLSSPKVKYRGIFLNDEAPALSGWAQEKCGGFNHQFYDKVFELILRLKGNYLWPAMWGSAFYDDDPMNGELANEYGIVMGTSHHEPLGRAHAEWSRYGSGPWDYNKNKDTLDKFWREGMLRMKDWDKVVTVGMRGDGDESMSEETNTELLENIVRNQREIIEEVTHNPAHQTPQLWALYKEVQEYYDKGMTVPDDVTLLLCDDNWGNVRKLPELDAPKRSGGYGMYYHFDYVGGPRNYKWLNTCPIPRVWEQMHLCYEYDVDQIWIVNVGDLKPMELPITFFLDYAWNPDDIPLEKLDQYTTNWAKEQFGDQYASDIAQILDLYTKYNGRRTPELLFSDTYSLINYREFERVTNDYVALANKSAEIFNQIAENKKDAYYQLVHFPVLACSNLYELYYNHAKNLLYAKQERHLTNQMANAVDELFSNDALLAEYYHTMVSGGKWNHMMSQTHIGYSFWQQPEVNIMPQTIRINIPKKAALGVGVEGSEKSWPLDKGPLKLPEFDAINDQHFRIDIFNKGEDKFHYQILTTDNWVEIAESAGEVSDQKQIEVSIKWSKLKKGRHHTKVIVKSDNSEEAVVWVNALKLEDNDFNGFVERNGYVSMEANHYTSKLQNDNVVWKEIPGLGKTGSSMTTFPVITSISSKIETNPHLVYDFYLLHSPKNEEVEATVYLSPTLNFKGKEGLQFALSVDDQKPVVVNMHEGMDVPDWKYPEWFNNAVANKIITKKVKLKLNKQGQHTLKYYMIDGGVILQKLVIDNGGLKPSYLGPEESIIMK